MTIDSAWAEYRDRIARVRYPLFRMDDLEAAFRAGAAVNQCEHEWHPMLHYDKPGTGFEQCAKCGDDRPSPPAKEPQS